MSAAGERLRLVPDAPQNPASLAGAMEALPEPEGEASYAYLGEVAVDSGTVIIADPCYASEVAGNWRQAIDTMGAGDSMPHGQIGLGVVSGTAYGDGSYPVYAKMRDGVPVALEIIFDDDDDDEDDDESASGVAKMSLTGEQDDQVNEGANAYVRGEVAAFLAWLDATVKDRFGGWDLTTACYHQNLGNDPVAAVARAVIEAMGGEVC